MSKPKTIKKRKRRSGYINLTKPSPFKHTFSTFAALAAHFGAK